MQLRIYKMRNHIKMKATCKKQTTFFAVELQKTLSSPTTMATHCPGKVDREASGNFCFFPSSF